MKITLTMATSLNGMIATKAGDEDFLSEHNWARFVALAQHVGCFIWGRKTYEAVNSWGGSYLDDLQGVEKVVISRSEIDLAPDFSLAKSPEDAVRQLETAGFHHAIITGGSTINTEFARRGMIDEVILDVNPSILGEGIPLFNPADFQLALELVAVEKIGEGIVELKYRVLR